MKRFFSIKNLVGTITVFVTVWIVGLLAVSLDFLNVFEQILGDYNLTDLAFHFKEKPKKDERIVVVNIGNLNRAGIAQQIMILNQYKPKVIGIDAFFSSPKDSIGDAILAEALANTENIVLGSKVMEGKVYPNDKILWGLFEPSDSIKKMSFYPKEKVVWDSLRKSYSLFSDLAHSGFVNVITEGDSDFETWREEPVQETLKSGKKEICFGAKIVQLYDSTKTSRLLARKNPYEIINYRGNKEAFLYLDTYDVFDDQKYKPEDIEGKIIVMGYLGGETTKPYWDDDKYYSPMNKIQVGRTTPDMYGVLGHANFISMVLDEDYVNEIHDSSGYIIAFILCFINVALFNYMLHSKVWEPWYDGVSKSIQLVQLILLGYLTYYLFVAQNLKIDLSATAIVVLFSGDLMELYNGFLLTQYKRFKTLKRSR